MLQTFRIVIMLQRASFKTKMSTSLSIENFELSGTKFFSRNYSGIDFFGIRLGKYPHTQSKFNILILKLLDFLGQ